MAQDAAKLLAQPSTLRILNLATRTALPAKDIAEALDADLKSTWYLLRKLLAAGLLAEAGKKPRSGRPQKLYQVAADSFFVPSNVMVVTAGTRLSTIMRDSLDAAETCEGEAFFYDGERWRVDKVFAPNAQAVSGAYETWAFADLTAKELAALQSDIEEVFERYRGRHPAQGRKTLFHFSSIQTDLL